MPGAFDPKGLHGPGTALIHCQAVGEINDLVLCPVNDQHRRGDFRYLVDAAKQMGEGDRGLLQLCSQTTHITLNGTESAARGEGGQHCGFFPPLIFILILFLKNKLFIMESFWICRKGAKII